jgi:hypothetical protein
MRGPVKLMAEYYGEVLWGVEPDEVGPVDPNSLSLPATLVDSLRHWADQYDKTFNQDDPEKSGFATQHEEDVFEAEGMRLARELARVLGPERRVLYFSWRHRRLLDSAQDFV